MTIIDSNPELESLVLSTMMFIHNPSNDKLIESFDILDVGCFTDYSKKVLFTELSKAHLRGEHISTELMSMKLLAIDPDLLLFLTALPERVTDTGLISWSRILRSLKEKRALITLLENSLKKIQATADEEVWKEEFNTIPDGMMSIKNSDPYTHSGLYTARECITNLRKERENKTKPISTGFQDLDKFFKGGFKHGTLAVIGAPPSAGKTEFSTRLLHEISLQYPEKDALMFSLEMRQQEITEKIIEHRESKPIELLTNEQLFQAEEEFSRTNIFICDKSPVSVEYMRAACKRSQLRNGVSVVVVDFLDKIAKPSSELRTDEKLADIASKLKDIAKEFNCVVILLTQLNKAAINRADKRPNMNDSKNSNGAAEMADYWMGIKRIGQWDLDRKYPDSNLVEIIIDKNRFGTNGIFYLDLHYHLYREIDQRIAVQLVAQSNELRSREQKEETGNYKKKSDRVVLDAFDIN